MTGNIERLRRLRSWHYAQAAQWNQRAEAVEALSGDAADRTSTEFRKRANENLRFVQDLNEFFPANDRIV